MAMKLFIATPLLDGAHRNYLESLVRFAAEFGQEWAYGIESGTLIGSSRNRLAKRFLDSDCTDLLFIDGDIGFTTGDVRRILSHNERIVGGCYPLKLDGKPTLVLSPVDGAKIGPGGLQECVAIGTGFLRIERSALERFQQLTPHLAYEDNGPHHNFFDSYIDGGQLLGEDVGFCRRWTRMGGTIQADWGIQLGHSGNKIFRAFPEKQTTQQKD